MLSHNMNSEFTFRLIVIAVFVTNLSITLYHRLQAAKSGEKISRAEEGKVLLPLRALGGLSLWLATLTYIIFPKSIAWSMISLPSPLRWVGAGIAILNIPFLYWVLHNLGTNITDTVFIRANHRLVTTGPYRWVRHPFYVSLFACFIALSLVSANRLIGLLTFFFFLVLFKRTDREEAKLIERFGDAYRQYMQRTGRFFPKFAALK
jgi:protein-S-isoprenylcysteine O-methyltransferase Ste14